MNHATVKELKSYKGYEITRVRHGTQNYVYYCYNANNDMIKDTSLTGIHRKIDKEVEK